MAILNGYKLFQVFKSDKRPQVQQVDDLLQEICDEVEIDSHQINYAEDVQDRLNRFKGQDSKPGQWDWSVQSSR